MKSEEFEVLKSEIKRTHRRARPFDLINEFSFQMSFLIDFLGHHPLTLDFLYHKSVVNF